MYLANHIFGVEEKKFYFEGMGGNYNDNARAVSEKLHEKYPEATIVWGIDKGNVSDSYIPNYVNKATQGFSRLFHMATSKGWVFCLVTNNLLYKSKKQICVQCWHGDRGFKKMLKDADPMYKFEFKECNVMTSGSSFYTKLTKSAFNFTGDILETGSPRNDRLINIHEDTVSKIKMDLGINDTTKVVLYAPTFRDSNTSTQKENIDISKIIKCLESKKAEKWVCLGRLHPIVKNTNGFKSTNIINVSNYYDMADLLLVSDILITDYSSSASDFVLMKKPVILFQPDRDSFVYKDRELYFDIDKSPFWVAKSQEELERLIVDKTKDDIEKNCMAIDDFYGTNETGHASEDVVNVLLS